MISLTIVLNERYRSSPDEFDLVYPESDLHPCDLLDLIDEYIDRVINGQFIKILTHSELVIARIQRRVAESKLDFNKAKIRLLTGISIYHEEIISFDRDGWLDNALLQDIGLVSEEYRALTRIMSNS